MNRTNRADCVQHLNGAVKYYDSGWRYGRLRELRDEDAIVEHPMTGKRKVAYADLRCEEVR